MARESRRRVSHDRHRELMYSWRTLSLNISAKWASSLSRQKSNSSETGSKRLLVIMSTAAGQVAVSVELEAVHHAYVKSLCNNTTFP